MSEAKVIAITGATRGLGRALALELARRRHQLALCGRSASQVAALNEQPGLEQSASVVDVLDEKAVNQWAQQTVERIGAPDYLLNNAALINANIPFWEIPGEEFNAIVDVNLKGVANVCRAFLPAMLARGSGVLINFSSGYGHSTAPGVAPYCLSKFGIEGFSRALADDLPAGLASIPMSPGIIDTDMLRRTFGDAAGHYEGPESWAPKAADFILQLGPQHNGQSLRVPQ